MANKKLAQNDYKQSILKILNELCRNKVSITLWKLCLDRKWSLSIPIKVVRSNQSEMMFHVDSSMEKSLREIMNGEKVLRFHVESKNILFQCKLKYFNAPDLVVEIPKFLAIEDMRQNLRLKTESENDKVLIHKFIDGNLTKSKQFDKRLQDVSAGGLSIILSPQEEPYFHHDKGEVPALVTLGSKDLKVKLCLVNLITIEPNASNGLLYKSYKACFKFDSISPEDKQYIENYVLENYKLTA
jgi:hypothetical protein